MQLLVLRGGRYQILVRVLFTLPVGLSAVRRFIRHILGTLFRRAFIRIFWRVLLQERIAAGNFVPEELLGLFFQIEDLLLELNAALDQTVDIVSFHVLCELCAYQTGGLNRTRGIGIGMSDTTGDISEKLD